MNSELLNKVTQGDCLEVMQRIEDKSIDMILTDIPYGEVNRSSNGLRNLDKGIADVCNIDLDLMLKEFDRLVKGSVYIFCGIEQVSLLRKGLVNLGFSTRLVIWEKTNPSPMNGQHIWLSSIECCVFGKKKNATFNEHCKSSVLRFPCGRNKIHPTEKPLSLFEYLINTSTNEGDLVLDNCAGSFTTAIACENTKRNWICIEKENNYCEIGEKRIIENKKRLNLSLFDNCSIIK